MKKINSYSIIMLLLLPAFICRAQKGDVILRKVDLNMSSDNRVMESSMTIYGKRSTRTITSRSWGEGTKKAFTEYLSPAAEKGTKMLKLESQLWIYSPSTDRIIQISGHMLRQPVMGSDLSYEDLMDDRKLYDIYEAKLLKEETVEGRRTWLLELTAKVPGVAYFSQKIWIDCDQYVPLKQELYAKSGQLLKRISMGDVRKIQNRWFPCVITYKDMLKQGKGTEWKVNSIRFDEKIPDYIFSKAALKK